MTDITKNRFQRLRQAFSLKRFRRNEDGVTAVEFAFVGGPFILLIFAIIESSLFFFAGQVLESTVDNVGREVRTGQLQAVSQEDFKTRVCNETAVLFTCSGVKVEMKVVASFDELKNPPPPPTDFEDPSVTFTYQNPCAEQITQLTVYYEWPIITNYVQAYLSDRPNGKALLSAVTLFRTEPFVQTNPAC